MDLVPRDENGSPIDPKTAGVMHLYRAVSRAMQMHGVGYTYAPMEGYRHVCSSYSNNEQYVLIMQTV